MGESLLIRFRSDDNMVFKGFSASYVALNPLNEDFNSDTESSENSTPFPGSLRTVYVNRYKTNFDDEDEDEDEDNEDDDESNNSNVNQIHKYGHYKVPMVELEEDDDD